MTPHDYAEVLERAASFIEQDAWKAEPDAARLVALLALAIAVLSGCGGYLSPGCAAPWCRTRDGRHDCNAARAERDSIARADTTARREG